MPKYNDSKTRTDGLKWWTSKRSTWKSIKYQAHNEDFSKILWPEKFPKELLLELKEEFEEQGELEGYYQEYLNNPIDDSIAYFRKDDLQPIKESEEKLHYYIAGDLAISEKERAAYTVFVVAGLSAGGILKIVDIERFRGDSLKIVDTIFELHKTYKPEVFILEEENIAKSIGPFLYSEMARRQQLINLHTIAPTKDKRKRAQSIRARMRAKLVQVDMEAGWYPAFRDEVLAFDRGAYKDQVDALAHIGLFLDKMQTVPTLEEEEEYKYQEEVFDFYRHSAEDINFVTGY